MDSGVEEPDHSNTQLNGEVNGHISNSSFGLAFCRRGQGPIGGSLHQEVEKMRFEWETSVKPCWTVTVARKDSGSRCSGYYWSPD